MSLQTCWSTGILCLVGLGFFIARFPWSETCSSQPFFYFSILKPVGWLWIPNRKHRVASPRSNTQPGEWTVISLHPPFRDCHGQGIGYSSHPKMAEETEKQSPAKENRESHLRSLLKGLTWRVVATLTTVCVAYFILKERENAVQEALTIGAVEFFAKLGIYYLHERAWQKVPIGTVRQITGVKK